MLWRHTVNVAVETQEEGSRNAGAAQYSSGKELLFGEFERKEWGRIG